MKRISAAFRQSRTVMLIAALLSALLIPLIVTGTAQAETNRRICGAEANTGLTTPLAFIVKVGKDQSNHNDNSACNKAVNAALRQLAAQGYTGAQTLDMWGWTCERFSESNSAFMPVRITWTNKILDSRNDICQDAPLVAGSMYKVMQVDTWNHNYDVSLTGTKI